MAYEPHEWITGETITAALLNAMEQGIVDASDEITSVVANTLDAGEEATASLEGGVLTLGIPRGETGAAGATGATGATGEDGVGVASITLTVTDGAVTAGTWQDTGGSSHNITIN